MATILSQDDEIVFINRHFLRGDNFYGVFYCLKTVLTILFYCSTVSERYSCAALILLNFK